tara:strand:+ start:597 stop:1316 length:720 start_codon:yes stop_codon:yes gene_type:complete
MKGKKTKNKIIAFKQEKSYPLQLIREQHFSCPIWFSLQDKFVDSLNKASDPYIAVSKKTLKPEIDKRNKKFGNKGDMGNVFHSTSLIGDPSFLELQNYIGATSANLLDEMGFDIKDFEILITEMWVQEFAKKGGGHHTLHTHWNGHMSGFYFLKGSEKTSFPIFEDPRPGNLMNLLPEKDKSKITYASSQISYPIKPGKIMFFPSYLPHQFSVDIGYDPFRFIHWNCQAMPKNFTVPKK